jgi:hypothetical protein
MATGRGRLSSLDLVPEEGQEDIRWAYAELNKRVRTAADILFELNDRLTARGLEEFTISKSAFGRKSVAIARAADRIKTSRAIFAGIADHLTPENIDQGNVALGEYIKALIGEIVSEAESGGLSADEAMKLSRGFQAVVSAQKLSHDRKTKAEKDLASRVEKTADAVGDVARKAGLTAATVETLKAQILGIRKEA